MSESFAKTTVVPPRAVMKICNMMDAIARNKDYRKKLMEKGLIEEDEKVEYNAYAIVRDNGETFWRIYTDDLGERYSDIVYLQRMPGPKVQYMLQERVASDTEKGYEYKRYGPYTDMDELVETVYDCLCEDHVDITYNYSTIVAALEDGKHWDALAQIKACEEDTHRAHKAAKHLTWAAYNPNA